MSTRPRAPFAQSHLVLVSVHLVVIALSTALLPTRLAAQDTAAGSKAGIVVRYSEGTVHGFLDLQDKALAPLATGDLIQIPGNDGIESRMVLHFLDQSLFDESVTFTQHHVFALESYHLVQRGPAFARDIDAHLSRDGGYHVMATDHDDHKVTRYEGRLDLPSSPDDTHIWILMDRAPAFIRFQGPLYEGPVWSLGQIAPTWPAAAPKPSN